MENVEVVRALSNLGQHGEMSRNVPRELFVEPQRYLSAGNQFRPSLDIATREKRHLMTALNQRVA